MFTTVSALLTRLPGLTDEQAWQVFNDRYSPLLKGFFSKLGVTGDPARDLTQDTITKAIDGLRSGSYRRDRGRLRDWMGGIAKNVLREYRRGQFHDGRGIQAKTVFWDKQADPDGDQEQRGVEERFDQIWVRARLSALIRQASTAFSHRDLRCYFLVEVHKRPIAEVASLLKMSVSAVYSRRRAVAQWLLAVGPRFISRWEK